MQDTIISRGQTCSNRILAVFFGLVFCFLSAPFKTVYAAERPMQAVTLPLSIDYPLLRSLIVQRAFTDENETARILNEDDGCKRVTLSAPTITEDQGLIRFEVGVDVHFGAVLFGSCILPVTWSGFLVIHQEPVVAKDTWRLSFTPMKTTLLDANREPPTIAGMVWSMAEPHVLAYLAGISVHLLPPVNELKHFLLPLFPAATREHGEQMVAHLRPGKCRVETAALQIEIHTEVATLYRKGTSKVSLTASEIDAVTRTWEAWDAFLVHMFETLSQETLTGEDREILLTALLTTRYDFLAAMEEKEASHDFVREQFVTSWEMLAPIFRNHLDAAAGKDVLGCLAFFTAADALTALDALSPVLGLDISRQGLITLARMLDKSRQPDLAYQMTLHPYLREILDLGPGPKALGTAIKTEFIEIDWPASGDGEEKQSNEPVYLNLREIYNPLIPYLAKGLDIFTVNAVYANSVPQVPDKEEIKKWVFKKTAALMPYVEKIRLLLDAAIKENLKTTQIEAKYHDLYQEVVYSTAWQESCFRQFKRKANQVTYLRSYNNTSVGLMQINERVWRGIYDQNYLRWDIQYNAKAGCEVIDLYLRRYLLRRMNKMKNPDSIDNNHTLAGIMYAMYNGGPGQFYKFIKRNEKGKYYLSDNLFREKYEWMKQGDWEKVGKCLIGK